MLDTHTNQLMPKSHFNYLSQAPAANFIREFVPFGRECFSKYDGDRLPETAKKGVLLNQNLSITHQEYKGTASINFADITDFI